jgi:hypothetical protein
LNDERVRGGDAIEMEVIAANANSYSLWRHYSAPTSVSLGLFNNKEGEDQLSALLDINIKKLLLADLDTIVPYHYSPSLSRILNIALTLAIS